MAKAGAGEASTLSPDGATIPMSFTAIALCFVGDVSAHGGGLNAEGCHHDRKRGGYHCHRGGGAFLPVILRRLVFFAPSRISPLRMARGPGVFANSAEARAVCAARVGRGEPGYGPHLDRDGDGVRCEPR